MTHPANHTRTCRLQAKGLEDLTIGPGRPLTVITGPCVLESRDLALAVASRMKEACERLGLSFVFKGSFDKANRSSINSYRGPGLQEGLADLEAVQRELACHTTTDLHEPAQAWPVSQAVSLLQIPAFLCRQTDLLLASGEAAREHNRAVNIKKAQFLSPREMAGPVKKTTEAGCDNILLTERGSFFGYHRLVNDFTGLGDLLDLDTPGGPPPVCFDVTHSTQLPGSGEQTGGRPDRAPLLARAATAAGVHCLFVECHPDPNNAKSDGSTQLTPEQAIEILESCARIREAIAPPSPADQQGSIHR